MKKAQQRLSQSFNTAIHHEANIWLTTLVVLFVVAISLGVITKGYLGMTSLAGALKNKKAAQHAALTMPSSSSQQQSSGQGVAIPGFTSAVPQSGAAGFSGPVVGTRRVAVITTNLASYNSISGIIARVQAWFNQSSYGQLNLEFIPVAVSVPQPQCAEPDAFMAWTSEVGKPSGFDNYIYLITSPGCSGGVQGVFFFGANETWISPSYWNLDVSLVISLLNNFGIPISKFGDIYNVVPSLDTFEELRVAYKHALGWIPDTDLQVISSSGTYSLASTQSSSGTRELIIKGRCSSPYYGWPTTDLSIEFSPNSQRDARYHESNRDLVLSCVGKVSSGENNRFGFPLQHYFATGYENVVPLPSAGTWTLIDDRDSVGKRGILLNGLSISYVPGGKAQVLFVGDFNPGASNPNVYGVDICDLNFHPNSQNKCVADGSKEADSAPGSSNPTNNSSPTGGSAASSSSSTSGQTGSPTFEILSPGDGAGVSGNFQVSARATPAHGSIQRMKFFVDGFVSGHCPNESNSNASPCDRTVITSTWTAGQHEIMVEATDGGPEGSNKAYATIHVTYNPTGGSGSPAGGGSGGSGSSTGNGQTVVEPSVVFNGVPQESVTKNFAVTVSVNGPLQYDAIKIWVGDTMIGKCQGSSCSANGTVPVKQLSSGTHDITAIVKIGGDTTVLTGSATFTKP